MTTVTAVVPVKRLTLAKSRLALDDDQRRDLALAFALDTVAALSASRFVRAVVVVTGDPVVAEQVEALDAHVVGDRGHGLVASVRSGTRAARLGAPGDWVVVVPGDLPCLRPADVDRVVAAARGAGSGAFVADRSGTGTTMLLLPPGVPATTAYGPGSAARHRALGLLALADAPAASRHDVDTVDDLRAALRRGVGPATSAVVTATGLPGVPGLEASAS